MRRIIVLLLAILPAWAAAVPDRASLVAAWEAAMRHGGTLEAGEAGHYRYHSDELGYDGGLMLVAVVVRAGEPAPLAGEGVDASGTVEFSLDALTPAQREARSIAFWKSQHEQFFHDAASGQWLTSADWALTRYRDADGGVDSGGVESGAVQGFLREHFGTLALLVILVVSLWFMSRGQGQVKAQLDEAREINRIARENVERAAQLQEEQRALVHEAVELERRSLATLEAILAELRGKSVP